MNVDDDERLRLPFDQYQRYATAASLVDRLVGSSDGRVIDVGGAPGPCRLFWPQRPAIVIDPTGSNDALFVRGDGSCLPFPDASAPAVVSLDTLEHVPPSRREPFLRELVRVSDEVVVLSAPFADPLVRLAEDALNDFIRARFGAFPTLDEHAEHGLPDLAGTVSQLEDAGCAVATLESGYLPRWLAGMLIHHELLATGLESLPGLHAFYNAVVSPLDARAPSYRHVVVASRRHDAATLAEAVDHLRSPGDEAAGKVALTALLATVTEHRLHSVMATSAAITEAAGLRDQIEDLGRQIADRDAHLLDSRRQIHLLEAALKDAEQRAVVTGDPEQFTRSLVVEVERHRRDVSPLWRVLRRGRSMLRGR